MIRNPTICAARGCGAPISNRILTCLRCWRLLPDGIRRRVVQFYQAGQLRKLAAVRDEAVVFLGDRSRRQP